MKSAARIAIVLAILAAARPALPDVVPARKPRVSPEQATVAATLTRLGAHPEIAAREASLLTPSEASYFAADPLRLRPAGARQDFFSGQSINLWYESLAGAAMLAGGVGAAYYMIHLNE